MDDPYRDDAITCPPNRFGLTDPGELQRRETPLALRRLLELGVTPIHGAFESKHLRAIHRYIFQDVYSWAGEVRSVSISKPGALFPPPEYLGPALDDLFSQLASEALLQALSTAQFARRAAYYLGEINAIHPFREGNGRAQREFIRELAAHAGHRLLWRGHTQAQMTGASIMSFLRKDYSGLEEILKDALVS
jgi:cell filamentation protein